LSKEVDDYIEKQKSPQREICQNLREIILEEFPGIKEEMKLGVRGMRINIISLPLKVTLTWVFQ